MKKIDFIRMNTTNAFEIKRKINAERYDVVSIVEQADGHTIIWYWEEENLPELEDVQKALKELEDLKSDEIKQLLDFEILITEGFPRKRVSDINRIVIKATQMEIDLFCELSIEEQVLFIENKTGISFYNVQHLKYNVLKKD